MVPNPQSEKILFVDDERSILSGFKLTLGREFNLSLAASGAEGLEVFKKEGPFSVLVFDFMMPEMNGAEFLSEIRKIDQQVVAMLLTGATNFDSAAQAVRMGNIFRLLSKPCNGEELKEHLREALRHYHTLRSEQDMLALTMNGAVRAMTSILSAAKPLYFGRAQRVKRLAFQLAEVLGIQDPWCLELAVTFYYLGFLSLPEEVQENLYHKRDVAAGIQEIIQRIPSFTESALKDIPRLDEIIEVIKSVDQDFDSSGREQEEITKLSSIIRLSKDYDEAASAGHARPKIFEWLLKNRSRYLSGGLEALSRIRDYSDGGPQLQAVKVADLKQGMRIQEDLRLSNGYLVAPQGSVVTDSFLVVLKNYRLCYANDPLPDQVEVIMGSSYADSLN
jgi:response regulator RpfG family c-di-GMP phosphodiesterase